MNKARAIVVGAGLLLTAASPAQAAEVGPPTLNYGYGLSQAAPATGSSTNFLLTVNTAQVALPHEIKIILPSDYYEQPNKRYPVLYFLHGADNHPSAIDFPALNDASEMITVIPDGGKRGWYSNWRDQNTAAGPQNWENFHINQVIPFIDSNLRTIATKKARAVAGISMGGFGALHYAQLHPDLFDQVGTLSGDNDLSAASMDLRFTAVATLTNGVGAFCTSGVCNWGPTVSSDALFGSPYPVFNVDWMWNAANPTNPANIEKLRGKSVSIYVGNGRGDVTALEFWLEAASQRLSNALNAKNIPHHFVNYGDGTGWGACQGQHDTTCWAQDLVDLVPRLQQGFTTP
ncbi:hypothetical protein GCM10027589_46650 [Actinocorallia lasiicapitis]